MPNRMIEALKENSEYLPEPAANLIAGKIAGIYQDVWKHLGSPGDSVGDFFAKNPAARKSIQSGMVHNLIPALKTYQGNIAPAIDAYGVEFAVSEEYREKYKQTALKIRDPQLTVGGMENILTMAMMPAVMGSAASKTSKNPNTERALEKIQSGILAIKEGIPSFDPSKSNFIAYATGKLSIRAQTGLDQAEERQNPFGSISLNWMNDQYEENLENFADDFSSKMAGGSLRAGIDVPYGSDGSPRVTVGKPYIDQNGNVAIEKYENGEIVDRATMTKDEFKKEMLEDARRSQLRNDQQETYGLHYKPPGQQERTTATFLRNTPGPIPIGTERNEIFSGSNLQTIGVTHPSIAFIGTRETQNMPAGAVERFIGLAKRAAGAKILVKTGAAPGSDQMAAEAALGAGGTVNLILPWDSYEKNWVSRMEERYPGRVLKHTYDPEVNPAWDESVDRYHPAADRLNEAVRKLHARNYGIVEGVGAVVALSDGEKGGTGQGIRVAKGLGIGVYHIGQKGVHLGGPYLQPEEFLQAVSAPPVTPVAGTLAMRYKFGDDARPGVQSGSTFDAIVAGERTSTTRWGKEAEEIRKYKAGDIVRVQSSDARNALVKITKPAYPLNQNEMAEKPGYMQRWSQLEGWSEQHGRELFARRGDGWGIQYEYLGEDAAGQDGLSRDAQQNLKKNIVVGMSGGGFDLSDDITNDALLESLDAQSANEGEGLGAMGFDEKFSDLPKRFLTREEFRAIPQSERDSLPYKPVFEGDRWDRQKLVGWERIGSGSGDDVLGYQMDMEEQLPDQDVIDEFSVGGNTGNLLGSNSARVSKIENRAMASWKNRPGFREYMAGETLGATGRVGGYAARFRTRANQAEQTLNDRAAAMGYSLKENDQHRSGAIDPELVAKSVERAVLRSQAEILLQESTGAKASVVHASAKLQQQYPNAAAFAVEGKIALTDRYYSQERIGASAARAGKSIPEYRKGILLHEQGHIELEAGNLGKLRKYTEKLAANAIDNENFGAALDTLEAMYPEGHPYRDRTNWGEEFAADAYSMAHGGGPSELSKTLLTPAQIKNLARAGRRQSQTRTQQSASRPFRYGVEQPTEPNNYVWGRREIPGAPVEDNPSAAGTYVAGPTMTAEEYLAQVRANSEAGSSEAARREREIEERKVKDPIRAKKMTKEQIAAMQKRQRTIRLRSVRGGQTAAELAVAALLEPGESVIRPYDMGDDDGGSMLFDWADDDDNPETRDMQGYDPNNPFDDMDEQYDQMQASSDVGSSAGGQQPPNEPPTPPPATPTEPKKPRKSRKAKGQPAQAASQQAPKSDLAWEDHSGTFTAEFRSKKGHFEIEELGGKYHLSYEMYGSGWRSQPEEFDTLEAAQEAAWAREATYRAKNTRPAPEAGQAARVSGANGQQPSPQAVAKIAGVSASENGGSPLVAMAAATAARWQYEEPDWKRTGNYAASFAKLSSVASSSVQTFASRKGLRAKRYAVSGELVSSSDPADSMELLDSEGHSYLDKQQTSTAISKLSAFWQGAFDDGGVPSNPKDAIATVQARINQQVNAMVKSYVEDIDNSSNLSNEQKTDAKNVVQRLRTAITKSADILLKEMEMGLDGEADGWKEQKSSSRKLRKEGEYLELASANPFFAAEMDRRGGVTNVLRGPATMVTIPATVDGGPDESYMIGQDGYGGGYKKSGKWGGGAGNLFYGAYLMKRMFSMTVQPSVQEAEYYAQKIEEPMAQAGGASLASSREGVATRASMARDTWSRGTFEQFGGFSNASYTLSQTFPGMSRGLSGLGAAAGLAGAGFMTGMMAEMAGLGSVAAGTGLAGAAGPIGLAAGAAVGLTVTGMEARNALVPDKEPWSLGGLAEWGSTGLMVAKAQTDALAEKRKGLLSELGRVPVGLKTLFFGMPESEMMAQLTEGQKIAYEAWKAPENPEIGRLRDLGTGIKAITGEEYTQLSPALRQLRGVVGDVTEMAPEIQRLVKTRWTQGSVNALEAFNDVNVLAGQLGYGFQEGASVLRNMSGMSEAQIRQELLRGSQIARAGGMVSGYFTDPLAGNRLADTYDLRTTQEGEIAQQMIAAITDYGISVDAQPEAEPGAFDEARAAFAAASGVHVLPTFKEQSLAEKATELGQKYGSKRKVGMATQLGRTLEDFGVEPLEALGAFGALGMENETQLHAATSSLQQMQAYGSQANPMDVAAASMMQSPMQTQVLGGVAQRLSTLGNVDVGIAQQALSGLGMSNSQVSLFERMVGGDLSAWSLNAQQQGTYYGRVLNSAGMSISTTSGHEAMRYMEAQGAAGNPYARRFALSGPGDISPETWNIMDFTGFDQEMAEAYGDEGTIGASRLHTRRMHKFQNQQLELQQSNLDLSWDYQQQQWGFQDEQRALTYQSQMADFAYQRERSVTSNAFSIRQENLSLRRMNANQGFAARSEALQFQQMETSQAYAARGEAMQWEGMVMNQGFAERSEAISLARIQLNQELGGQTAQIGRERMMLGHENSLWMHRFGKETETMQRGWTIEDRGYEDQTRALQFGWSMEDINENIRYASGRERRQLIKQRDRLAMTHSLEEGQIETGRERQEELWAKEDERHAKQEEYLLKVIELDKLQYENAETQRKRSIELELQEYELGVERRKANFDLDTRQFEMGVEKRIEMYELDKQSWELNREQRLAMNALDKEQHTLNVEQRQKSFQMETDYQARKMEEFQKNWDIEQERIDAEREYQTASHENALKNLEISKLQAEENQKFEIGMEKISTYMGNTTGYFEQMIKNDPSQILKALEAMSISMKDVPKSTIEALGVLMKTISNTDINKIQEIYQLLYEMTP